MTAEATSPLKLRRVAAPVRREAIELGPGVDGLDCDGWIDCDGCAMPILGDDAWVLQS
jgi:hypothetical protein